MHGGDHRVHRLIFNRMHLNCDRNMKRAMYTRIITGYQWKLSVLLNEMRQFLFLCFVFMNLSLSQYEISTFLCQTKWNRIPCAKIACSLKIQSKTLSVHILMQKYARAREFNLLKPVFGRSIWTEMIRKSVAIAFDRKVNYINWLSRLCIRLSTIFLSLHMYTHITNHFILCRCLYFLIYSTFSCSRDAFFFFRSH